MDVFIEKVDVAAVVAEVRVDHRAARGQERQQPRDRPAPPMSASSSSDSTKVKQSLLNLLSNASKFTKDGTVTLTVTRERRRRRRCVDFARRRHRHRHDAGAARPSCSKPSARPIPRPRGNTAAPGSGLAITRHFCAHARRRRHGDERGRQRLGLHHQPADEPAAGAAPAAADDAGARDPHMPRAADEGDADRARGRRRRGGARAVGAMLAREGYRVLHARSGDEALAMAREHPPEGDHARRDDAADGRLVRAHGAQGRSGARRHSRHHGHACSTIAAWRLSLGAVRLSDQADRPAAAHRHAATNIAAIRANEPVLVVDDDRRSREMTRRMLERMGMRVVEAGNGREGLAWLAGQSDRRAHPARSDDAGHGRVRIPRALRQHDAWIGIPGRRGYGDGSDRRESSISRGRDAAR